MEMEEVVREIIWRLAVGASLVGALSACQTGAARQGGGYTGAARQEVGYSALCRSGMTGDTYTIHNAGCSPGDTLVANQALAATPGPAAKSLHSADPVAFEGALARMSGGMRVLNNDADVVFALAGRGGPKSAEYKAVTAALPKMWLTPAQVTQYVSPVMPAAAKSIVAQRTAIIRLEVEPDDRLLLDDLKKKIQSISDWINLSPTGSGTAVTIKVKKLQWDERRAPDRTQTVMYASHQVNLLAAALLMPRNATYSYEVITGGIELSYAFEVKATDRRQPPFDRLVRKTASREWHSCSNARIQNVFGGIQPASFVANDHMQQVCSSSAAPASPSAVRDQALDDVVQVIREIPAIRNALSRSTP